MTTNSPGRNVCHWLAGGAAFGLASYVSYVGVTWLRYGKQKRRAADDALLDRFMPAYDVADRHAVRVAAPAEMTLSAAIDCDFADSVIVSAIFRGREAILGSDAAMRVAPRGLLAQVTALGWGVLAEVPGREIVCGAVTRPWEANVVFRAIPPEDFASFNEPDYAKIVWTLRADPINATSSVVRTETRVATTDAPARAKFRRYWSFLSPGILLIRRVMPRLAKSEAERRFRAGPISTADAHPWEAAMPEIVRPT